MKFNSGALFEKLRGGSGGGTLNIALYVGLAIFIVLALANFLLSATTANRAQENITRASEMRVISQQIAKNALEAAAGNADAFELLDKSQKKLPVRLGRRQGRAGQRPASHGAPANPVG